MDEQKRAFENLKTILVISPVLKFYDKEKPMVMSVDKSNSLLGGYALKSFKETQMHFAQIKKELLAICFALSKFYEYIYGVKFIVEADHQPQ